MAKTLAGASGYAPDLSMNEETKKPTLETREREIERERESVGGTIMCGCGDGETLVRN